MKFSDQVEPSLNVDLMLLQRELRLLFDVPSFNIDTIKQKYSELKYKANREPFLEELTTRKLLQYQSIPYNRQIHCVADVWGEIMYDTDISYCMGNATYPLAEAKVYTADHAEAINWVNAVGFTGPEPYVQWDRNWLRIKWLPLEIEYSSTQVFNSIPRITLYGSKEWHDIVTYGL